MNSRDLERRIADQPLREPPDEWRNQILGAARAARTGREMPPAPSAFAVFRARLEALLWPSPRAWAGLALVWVLVAGLHLSTGTEAPHRTAASPVASPELVKARKEQEKLLAELIGREPGQRLATRTRSFAPRPRSEAGPVIAES